MIANVRNCFCLDVVESLPLILIFSLSHDLFSSLSFSSLLILSLILRSIERDCFMIVSKYSSSFLSLVDSAQHKLKEGVASSHINLSVNPDSSPFALTKSFQPFPSLISPFLSSRSRVSHFVPSLPNRYISPGLLNPFSFTNSFGRVWRCLNRGQIKCIIINNGRIKRGFRYSPIYQVWHNQVGA